MRHARPDYDRFQDPAAKIPMDEPVFILRGQDRCAPDAVRAYAAVVAARGGDPEIIKLSRDWADEMDRYQKQHGHKMPDLPVDGGTTKG